MSKPDATVGFRTRLPLEPNSETAPVVGTSLATLSEFERGNQDGFGKIPLQAAADKARVATMRSGATMLTSGNGGITTQTVVADNVDTFSATLPGLELDIIRTGTGAGPNITRHAAAADIMLASTSVQFPLLGRATIADDRVVVAFLPAVPRGSRWDEVDLVPGMMMLYGPEAEHAGPDIPGLRYVTLSLSVDRLEATADLLNVNFKVPPPGRIQVMAPTPLTARLHTLLASVDDPLLAKINTTVDTRDAFHAFATALSDPSARTATGRRGRLDSRAITRTCIAYVEAIR